MENTNTNFIFRRRQRKLTILSVLALLPLFAVAASVALVSLGEFSLGSRYISLVTAAPYWLQAIIYILLPLWSIYQSHQMAKRGTLYNWRTINKVVRAIGVALMILEILVIVFL